MLTFTKSCHYCEINLKNDKLKHSDNSKTHILSHAKFQTVDLVYARKIYSLIKVALCEKNKNKQDEILYTATNKDKTNLHQLKSL